MVDVRKMKCFSKTRDTYGHNRKMFTYRESKK